MGNLSNLYISQSYQSLIHLGNDSTVSSSLVELQDGLGNSIGVAVNSAGDLSISGSLTASLQNGYALVGDINGKTKAVPTSSFGGGGTDLTSLNAFTSSQNTKNTTLGTYTGSVDTKFNTIGSQSGSWVNTSLNVFSASQESKDNTLGQYTASNDTKWNTVGTQSGSWENVPLTSLNSFTQSQETKNSTLASYTASVDTKFNTIGSQSGSWITESESGSFLITASFDNNTRNLTFTKGDTTTFNVNIPDVSGSAGINTGSFATTGSNVFVGNQNIQNNLYIEEPGNPLIYTQFLQDPLSNKLQVYQAGASGIQLNNIDLSGVGTFTASLQEGYVWVGDSSGRTTTVATSSFATTINTGSFATTGSNQFNGSQNIVGAVTASTAQISGLKYPTADNGEKSFIQTDGAGNLSLQYVDTIFEAFYAGESVPKGTPLYFSGSQGANPIARAADASNPAKMPVIVVANENLTAGTTYEGVVLGLIEGINLTGYTAGQSVYVAEGGGWSTSLPSGSNSITQVLGIVTKGGNGGKGLVLNPGPAQLPGLQTGYAWVGNNNNQPIAIPTSSFAENTDLGPLNSFTSSQETKNSTLATYTGSNDTKWSNLGSQSGSFVLESETGSFAKTDANNVFGGNQTFNNIVVNGTASIAYLESVTGSAKIIGDAFIVLNNDTPAERYAGIIVVDSGSANTSASFQYDGVSNDWFYEYTGSDPLNFGVALFGPEYGTKGSPIYNTNNRIVKGNGGHHIIDSNISDDGSNVSINSNTQITGSLLVNGNAPLINSNLASLNSFTSSQESKDSTLATYTGSVDTKFATIGTQSGSWENVPLTSLNSFTQSQETKNSTLGTYTSSVDTKFSTIGTQSGSWDNTSLNQFSASQESKDSTLATYTGSVNTKFDTIGTQSGSWNNTSLNTFTASQESKDSTLATYTGSVDTKFNTIGTQSGSWENVPLTSLNAFTASQIVLNNQFADTGSNTFNGNQIVNGVVTQNVTAPATDTQKDFVTVTGATVSGDTYNYVNQGLINYPSFGPGYENTFAIEYYDSLSYIYGSEFIVNGKRVGGTIISTDGVGAASFRIQEQADGTTFGNMYADEIQLGEFPTGTRTRIGIGHTTLPSLELKAVDIDITGSLTVSGSINTSVIPLTITSNTASLNASTGNTFQLNLVSGSATRLEVSGTKSGQTINLLVSQSASGPGTLVFGSGIEQPSGSFYSASQVASGEDILTMATFINANRIYVANVKNFI
jgi:hypothetical protein